MRLAVTASMWHWRACCHTSRERRASAAQSSMGLYAKVPSAGAGATRCALLGHTQLSTTTSVLSVRRPDAASKLLCCSGAAGTPSAQALARRGRCGPCIALMTKKVEEGRRRHAGFMQWRASSAPRRALSFLLALTCMHVQRDLSRWFSLCHSDRKMHAGRLFPEPKTKMRD